MRCQYSVHVNHLYIVSILEIPRTLLSRLVWILCCPETQLTGFLKTYDDADMICVMRKPVFGVSDKI